ncbi:MAG TPA: acyltransferase family protein [Candidatus Limnocylindrales bacterium]
MPARPGTGRSPGPSAGPRRARDGGRAGTQDRTAPAAAGAGGAERDGFRPDLEGLRAVAVGLVLLFHAGVPHVTGGYVGVDVFFVLSGFLITGLIVRELDRTGTVSLAAFYARRARRLLPAAAVALVATITASAIFLPPLRVPDVAGDGAAAALYVSNMRFAFQATDYLQAASDPSPLLHYWSLGVEEQFYLFWPALLLFFARGGRGTIARLAAVVSVVFGVSLVLSLVLTGIAQPWAFFTLPARAWELAMGAGLALASARGMALPRQFCAPIGLLGIACIVAAGLLLDTTTPFPGLAALLPTAGAALVIAAGLKGAPSGPRTSGAPAVGEARSSAGEVRPAVAPARSPAGSARSSQGTGVSAASAAGRGVSAASAALAGEPIHIRLLSLPPMRWLGRISYSLYLWHWPILVIPAAAREAVLPLRTRLVLAGVSVVVAALSQRLVEEPIRRGRFVGLRPRRTFAFAGVVTLVAAGLSLSLIPGGPLSAPFTLAGAGSVDPGTIASDLAHALGSPGTGPTPSGQRATPGAPTTTAPPSPMPVPANLTPSLAAARDDLPPVYGDGCHLSYTQVVPPTCAFGDTSSSTNVVLLGDSHAAQWFPALVRAALAHHWRLLSFTKSACTPADIAVWDPSLNREYSECDTWRANVLRRIASEHPALVVVSTSRAYTLAIDGRSAPLAQHLPAMQAAITRTLHSLSAISRNVALIEDTPRSKFDPPVCLSAHMTDALACATPLAEAIDTPFRALETRAALAAQVALVDATAWICSSDPCPVIVGHVLVYRDAHHMTQTFAAALADYLVGALPAIGP